MEYQSRFSFPKDAPHESRVFKAVPSLLFKKNWRSVPASTNQFNSTLAQADDRLLLAKSAPMTDLK